MGYLARINFFNLLSEQVKVVPERPSATLISNYQNNNLVEFKSIRPKEQKATFVITRKLTDALKSSMGEQPVTHRLIYNALTIFTEYIVNIYKLSQLSIYV